MPNRPILLTIPVTLRLGIPLEPSTGLADLIRTSLEEAARALARCPEAARLHKREAVLTFLEGETEILRLRADGAPISLRETRTRGTTVELSEDRGRHWQQSVQFDCEDSAQRFARAWKEGRL